MFKGIKTIIFGTVTVLLFVSFWSSAAAADYCEISNFRVPENSSHLFYLNETVPFGKSCDLIAEYRGCDCVAGLCSFTGAVTYNEPYCYTSAASTCTEPSSGTLVGDGETYTFYEFDTVPVGETCVEELRTCSNGFLSGDFVFPSCIIDDDYCIDPSDVTSRIDNASTVTYFEFSSSPFGSPCVSEDRICTDGILSGTFNHSSCTVTTDPTMIPALLDVLPPDAYTPKISESVAQRAFFDAMALLVSVGLDADSIVVWGYWFFYFCFAILTATVLISLLIYLFKTLYRLVFSSFK